MDILDKEVEVYNDGELVLEGLLNEFLEINKEDREYILSQIDVNKKISELHETSGHWKIEFK